MFETHPWDRWHTTYPNLRERTKWMVIVAQALAGNALDGKVIDQISITPQIKELNEVLQIVVEQAYVQGFEDFRANVQLIGLIADPGDTLNIEKQDDPSTTE